MDISSNILEAIGKGECTLFLGAGASNPTGTPSGDELCDLITDKFLGGKPRKAKSGGPASPAKDWGLSLASAASLASARPGITRSDIVNFVHDRLEKPSPSSAHLKIPWFRWRAIVTTNYDCLIEESYKKEVRAIQKPALVLKEEDLPAIGATGPEIVPLLKPHGCISQRDSMSLSLEDIYQSRQTRRLLFTYIELLHLLGPVIYVGYSFKDVHILDMVCDLTSRLGPYRKPILFVTLQLDKERAERECNWIQGPLIKGVYLEHGFEQFMDRLAEQITPAIAPSMIIRQLAPCITMTFVGSGLASDTAFYKIGPSGEGEWEYWLTYKINDPEGFAGVIFERRDDTADISRYVKVTFELNIPRDPRKAGSDFIEAKLESTLKQYELLLDVKELRGEGWKEVTLPFAKQQKVPKTSLRRVVLADNGDRAIIGHEYKIGIRKIRFE